MTSRGRSSTRDPRYASMSTVALSAQCRSSSTIARGCARAVASMNPSNSRFMRSGDAACSPGAAPSTPVAWAGLESPTSRCQVGAWRRSSAAMSPDGSARMADSMASRMGRKASVPARRSEHRPRATTTPVLSAISARQASTNVVLPTPGSPLTTSNEPRPLLARCQASMNRARSVRRPTTTVVRAPTPAPRRGAAADVATASDPVPGSVGAKIVDGPPGGVAARVPVVSRTASVRPPLSSPVPVRAPRARATSTAVGRSAGSLASMPCTSPAMATGNCGRSCCSGTGSLVMIAPRVPADELPRGLNGCDAASSSYSTTPRPKTSEGAATGSPDACSGDR